MINLHLSKSEEVKWDGKAFKKMENLKTLVIKGGHFSQGPKSLPNSLRVLEWCEYPSESLPSNFHPKNLAILKLPSCFMPLKLDLPEEFVKVKVLNFDSCKCITEIPDVSSIPNLEELSFTGCESLVEIHRSIGFLNKLRILRASFCKKLRHFPSLNLTSLRELYLSGCSSLQRFPEILGKMENLTWLSLRRISKLELPASIKNLTRLREFFLEVRSVLQLPISIFELEDLNMLELPKCVELLLPEKNEGEEKKRSMMSGFPRQNEGEKKRRPMMSRFKPYSLRLRGCNISKEFLEIVLPRYINMTHLNLSKSNFTILPACIQECHYLTNLDVMYCKNLREIEWIPPNIEVFRAAECRSLSCLSRNMLLNERLHKVRGEKLFTLIGSTCPEWYEHCSSEGSISFWFLNNKFPAISLCVVTAVSEVKKNSWYHCNPKLFINGKKYSLHQALVCWKAHIQILDLKYIGPAYDTNEVCIQSLFSNPKCNMDEVLLENEWNHILFSIDDPDDGSDSDWDDLWSMANDERCTEQVVKQIGLHVFDSSMSDIRFTNPFKRRELDEGQGREGLLLLPPWNSSSMVSTLVSSMVSALAFDLNCGLNHIMRPRPLSLSRSHNRNRLRLHQHQPTSSRRGHRFKTLSTTCVRGKYLYGNFFCLCFHYYSNFASVRKWQKQKRSTWILD